MLLSKKITYLHKFLPILKKKSLFLCHNYIVEMIVANNITKSFGALQVLKGIDLSITEVR